MISSFRHFVNTFIHFSYYHMNIIQRLVFNQLNPTKSSV